MKVRPTIIFTIILILSVVAVFKFGGAISWGMALSTLLILFIGLIKNFFADL